MKKINFTLFLFLIILATGCSSLDNALSSVLPSKSNAVPLELQEQMATRVNPEQELFALGSAEVETSGAIIAQAKANKNAKDLLKGKIKKRSGYSLQFFYA